MYNVNFGFFRIDPRISVDFTPRLGLIMNIYFCNLFGYCPRVGMTVFAVTCHTMEELTSQFSYVTVRIMYHSSIKICQQC